MPYKAYADSGYYYFTFNGCILPTERVERLLRDASRHIDTLTYNRIQRQGFENLTEFQQEAIKEVCCLQAEFEYENADELESMLTSYSINGVSMSFDSSWKVYIENGVAMKRTTYSLLSQTGLCCRLAR